MRATTRTRLGGLGTLVAASAFAAAGSVAGLLAAAVVAVGWYALPAAAAFSVGQFALVALATSGNAAFSLSGGPALPLVAAECGLLAVLVAPTRAPDRPPRLAAVAAGGVCLLAAGGWAVSRWLGSLPSSVAVVAVGFALAAYGLHRYERVALGLVAADATENPPADTTENHE